MIAASYMLLLLSICVHSLMSTILWIFHLQYTVVWPRAQSRQTMDIASDAANAAGA